MGRGGTEGERGEEVGEGGIGVGIRRGGGEERREEEGGAEVGGRGEDREREEGRREEGEARETSFRLNLISCGGEFMGN